MTAPPASEALRLPFFWVDAFAERPFEGNPAAVVVLDRWLPDPLLRAIAAQHGLPVTAFVTGWSGRRAVRWFTPRAELRLCGHGTLAAGLVVATALAPGTTSVAFSSRAGPLSVVLEDGRLVLDLPSHVPVPIVTPAALVDALGAVPAETLDADVYVAVFEREQDVRDVVPDATRVASLDRRGVVVTAPGDGCDFVSRYFAPKSGVPEDPVTGSAHCKLTPYWARRLGRPRLQARQLSARGGRLWCEDRGERTRVAGRAVLYLEGTIRV